MTAHQRMDAWAWITAAFAAGSALILIALGVA